MKFYRSYHGTQEVYRIDPEGFHKPLNYISPEFEKFLRGKYMKLPKYNPLVKRLNTPEVAGYTPAIKNY